MSVNKLRYLQNLLALSAVTLIITVWSTVSFLVYQNKLIKEYSRQYIGENKTSGITADTANWKAYKNALYTLKYPNNWDEPKEYKQSTRLEINFGTKLSIVTGSSYNQDLKRPITFGEYINNFYSRTSKTYTLDNFQGKYFSFKDSVGDMEDVVAVAASDDSTEFTTLTFKYPAEYDNDLKIFDQILSTFKFIDNKDVEGSFCGGIAGISCPAGYECKLDGYYPDAGGRCVKN